MPVVAEMRSVLAGGKDVEVQLSIGPMDAQYSAVLGFGDRGT